MAFRFGPDGFENRVSMGGRMEDDAETAMMESFGENSETDKSQKILRIIKDDIEAGKRANENDRDLRVNNYNIYRAKGDGKQDRPGRSRIRSSDTMDAIEWMMPSFMRTFAGSTSCITVAPVGSEDVIKAEKLQKLLNWQFMGRRVKGFNVLYEWIKTALIYGTSVVKVFWDEAYVKQGFDMPIVSDNQMQEILNDNNYLDVYGTPEEIPAGMVITEDVMKLAQASPEMLAKIGMANAAPQQIQPVAIEPLRVYREVHGKKRIKSYSGPVVEVISPEDFFIDPKATEIANAQFVIHRKWKTFGELRELEQAGVYKNVDSVKEWIDRDREHHRANTENAERYAAAGTTDPAVTSLASDKEQLARKELEVFEWWGLLDLDGEGYQEPYLVEVCGESILRMEKNPYGHEQAPFEVLRPMLDPFKFTGIGMPELVGEFQQVKTALMRQTLDNISFQNNGAWLVNRNAGVDMNALLHPRPGMIVRTNIVQGAVQPLAPSSLQSMPLHAIELVDSMMQKRTGVTSYNQGLDANSLNKTATGITKIMNASQQRIELIARVMAETGIKPLYQKMLSLDQQFIDQTIVIRVFNQPIEISPDDLAGEFDVVVDVGGATGQDEMRSQQMMMLIQYAANLMQLGVMRPMNIYETCKQLMQVWGWKDFDRYLTNPDEIGALKQAMGIIEQMGAMVQNGQAPAPQMIVQAFQQIYDLVNRVIGASAMQNMPLQGTPSNDALQAMGVQNGGQYTASQLPTRPVNSGNTATA